MHRCSVVATGLVDVPTREHLGWHVAYFVRIFQHRDHRAVAQRTPHNHSKAAVLIRAADCSVTLCN